MSMSKGRTIVVLVHGAWADGSSWSDVIAPLLSEGLRVQAAPIPLTSLSDDVAALERCDGPIVLAAHAYAGAVIAASRNERVRTLVYIAALAPDEGETVADVFYRGPSHPLAPRLAPDVHGFIWMPQTDPLPLSHSTRRPIGWRSLPRRSDRSRSPASRRRPLGPPGKRSRPGTSSRRRTG